MLPQQRPTVDGELCLNLNVVVDKLRAIRHRRAMLGSQRRSLILTLVEESGAVRVADLVERLGVSDMTIRRDIERLSADGLLERVHGGALAISAGLPTN